MQFSFVRAIAFNRNITIQLFIVFKIKIEYKFHFDYLIYFVVDIWNTEIKKLLKIERKKRTNEPNQSGANIVKSEE